MTRYAKWASLLTVFCGLMPGCGKTTTTPKTASTAVEAGQGTSTRDSKSGETKESADEDAGKSRRKAFKPVEIGATGSAGSTSSADTGERVESARVALKPLQILIGSWNGTSHKAAIDQPSWTWDLKSDPKQPALRMKSEKGQYVRDGRLTFVPATQSFEFTAADAEGTKRVFRGNFSQEVQDIPGDDKKLQRTFKLELTEPEPNEEGEQWRVVINQQENNRYILEMYRKRGSGSFLRIDSINTQREGTSFALSDTDYGEKTCIVSQGLGTTSVSYKGKSYWVCCSGCKAAFEEEPERWIAKWEAMNKDKMNKQ